MNARPRTGGPASPSTQPARPSPPGSPRGSRSVEPALPGGDRVALHVATPDSGSREALAFWQAAQTTGVALAAPGAFPWTLSNSVTGRVSLALGITGPCTTWVGGPEAATEAELAASLDLDDGIVDHALVVASPGPSRRMLPGRPSGSGCASWCSAGRGRDEPVGARVRTAVPPLTPRGRPGADPEPGLSRAAGRRRAATTRRARASIESMTVGSSTPRSSCSTDSSVQPSATASAPWSRRWSTTASNRSRGTGSPALTPS